MLPSPNYNQARGSLAQDVTVDIIDAVNASKTKQQQIDELLGKKGKDAPTALEDSEPPENVALTSAGEYKYTVKDPQGQSAFLISSEIFNIGARIIVKQGTETWRSVLLPRSAQVQCIKKGAPLSRDAMIAKLESELAQGGDE